MADVPPEVNYGTVIGRFVAFIADSTDPEAIPDEIPLSGKVTLTPLTRLIRFPTTDPPRTAIAAVLTCPVIDGDLHPPDGGDIDTLGVTVIATDQPAGVPSLVQWQASFALSPTSVQPATVVFNVPTNGIVDLSLVIPSPPEPPAIIVNNPDSSIEAIQAAEDAQAAADAAEAAAAAAESAALDTVKVTTQTFTTVQQGQARTNIRGVGKGELVVNVKDYGATGGGTVDDTAAINAAIAANPGKIIWVPDGTYMINATATVTASPGSQPAGILMNQARTTLHLSSGATLQAITNGSQRYSVVQVSAADCVIEGGTITGELLTHTDTLGQWGYCIELTTGSHRAQVVGTRCNLAWADGIFVVGNPTDIRIVNVVCDQNRRQGMSITDATRPMIIGGHYMNTGTVVSVNNPGAGIDIEPDPGTGRNVVDAVLIGVNFVGNKGPGLALVGAVGQLVSATVTGCRATNSATINGVGGFYVAGGLGTVVANFSGCTAKDNTLYGFRIIPDGVTLSGCVARNNGQYGFRFGAPAVVGDCHAELNGLHGFSFDAPASGSRMTGGGSKANSQTTHQGAANVEIYCTMSVTGHCSEIGTMTNKPAYGYLIRSGAVVRVIGCDAVGFTVPLSDSAGTTVVSPALGIPNGAPTATAQASNGTGRPAPVVSASSRNNRGNITFGSGTGPAAGAQIFVTFTSAFPVAPIVAIVPKNAATAALGLYVSATAVQSFTVSSTVAPTASQANTVYEFDFIVA